MGRRKKKNGSKRHSRIPGTVLTGSAEPARSFLDARCDAEVEAETVRHIQVLERHINFLRVPRAHPLRHLWSTPSSKARFELHHLADDISFLEHAPGFKGLLKRLLEDAEAYEDYRYELRLAASVARNRDQEILSLAGNAAGPDLVFRSRSGHRCGVACYRARTAIPALDKVSNECRQMVLSLGRGILNLPIGISCGVEVIFPEFPARPAHQGAAVELLRDICRIHSSSEFTNSSGVRARRVILLSSPWKIGTARRLRVRFLFPVPSAEKVRIDRQIADKLVKEDRWASSFEGVAIMAIEQSAFTRGLGKTDLEAVASNSGNAFTGAIATQLTHPTTNGIAHGFETVEHFIQCSGLNLRVETYGQNFRAWADDYAVVTFKPDHAEEFWDLWQDAVGIHLVQSNPLSMDQYSRRLSIKVRPEEIRAKASLVAQEAAGAFGEYQKTAEEVFDW
jgi:hypothetical protein